MQMRSEDEADRVAGAIEAPDVGDTEAAKKKAGEILARDRATVDDIAWAWVTLLDLEIGNGLTSGEARYRKILFAKEEIEKLGLLKTDEAGFPVRKYIGVPVSGMNDGAIVRGLVSVPSVRDAFMTGGVSWPGVNAAITPAQPAPMGNRISSFDRDYLIKKAIETLKQRGIPIDRYSLWDELSNMANNETGCLLSASGGVIHYRSDDPENPENVAWLEETFARYWARNKSKKFGH